MLDFFAALFGYLMARLIWDAVKHYAAKQGELPLVWALKVFCLLAALGTIVGGLGLFVIYAFSRSH